MTYTFKFREGKKKVRHNKKQMKKKNANFLISEIWFVMDTR